MTGGPRGAADLLRSARCQVGESLLWSPATPIAGWDPDLAGGVFVLDPGCQGLADAPAVAGSAPAGLQPAGRQGGAGA